MGILRGRKTKQIFSLYLSLAFTLLLGIGVSVINTRFLGPEQYGDLKFLQNIFGFSVMFFTLGFFVSGARLIAQKENEKIKHEIIGILFSVATCISAALSIGYFVFSFFEEQIFNNELGIIIRIFCPLLFVYPFVICLQNIMQGDSRIYELSVFRLAPKLLYIIVAIVFNFIIPLKLVSALSIQFLTLGLPIMVMIFLLKPEFKNLKENSLRLWKENKYYGFQVYIGSLASVASSYLGAISLGYFGNNIDVGFFSLAVTITMPLTMIPGVVGTTFFKDFTSMDSLPKKATMVTMVFSLFALLSYCLVIEKIILVLYSDEYYDVVSLSYIISAGCIFHGFGDYINRFLGAHGMGTALRNAAITVGLSNVSGYILLVYAFGVVGAAVTKLAAGIVYCIMMYFYYNVYIPKNE
ncbi:MAG: oligosaccharide flippase family protein [Candidatus Hodarchaeota archaeon]